LRSDVRGRKHFGSVGYGLGLNVRRRHFGGICYRLAFTMMRCGRLGRGICRLRSDVRGRKHFGGGTNLGTGRRGF
jgi:hypothetical protein